MTNHPKFKVLESSIENIHSISSDVLTRAGKSKVIPPIYKRLLRDLSTACVAALNHLDVLKEEIKDAK